MPHETVPVDAVAASYVDLTVAIVALTERMGGIEKCLEAMSDYIQNQDEMLSAAVQVLQTSTSHLATMAGLLDQMIGRITPGRTNP
jgi:hypothetical protein